MKPVRYAVLTALAGLLFSVGGAARADSVGLAFGPAGIYYFDYHSGYYHHGYRHEYRGHRHEYKRPYWAYPSYRHRYRSYGYWRRGPVRRDYRHYYHRDWHRDRDHDWDHDWDRYRHHRWGH